MPPDAPAPRRSLFQSLRAFLQSDMLVLRWVFLALYLATVLAFFVFFAIEHNVWFWLIVFLIHLAAQAIFIFGSGTIQLCFPITRKRLLLPIIVAAFMLTVLVFGLIVALSELFMIEDAFDKTPLFPWLILLASWAFWTWLLFTYACNWHRIRVISRLATFLFAGSLAELLATVPSHIITSRRPQCLTGIGTMIGIIAGLNVMLFSFGPAIVLLFLRPRYRLEAAQQPPTCPQCGYDLRASKDRCPECGHPIPTPSTSTSVTLTLRP